MPEPTAVTAADVFARLAVLIAAQQVARVQEAEQELRADVERVQDVVGRNNARWDQLRAEVSARIAEIATEREKLLLGRLDSKSAHAIARGLPLLRAGLRAEADKFFRDYNTAQGDACFVWRTMIDRAYQHVDNRSRTDNFLMGGELQTVVQAVDAAGRPVKLSKYGVMP